tara:strand:+ start:19062 stop:19352 length:291 start_codon:yes stop_codon:yes gene_type:complete
MTTLKDIAEIRSSGRPGDKLADNEIVMGLAGNRIGEIINGEARQEAATKPNYCIITAHRDGLEELILKNVESIKNIATGTSMQKVSLKDLADLEFE